MACQIGPTFWFSVCAPLWLAIGYPQRRTHCAVVSPALGSRKATRLANRRGHGSHERNRHGTLRTAGLAGPSGHRTGREDRDVDLLLRVDLRGVRLRALR